MLFTMMIMSVMLFMMMMMMLMILLMMMMMMMMMIVMLFIIMMMMSMMLLMKVLRMMMLTMTMIMVMMLMMTMMKIVSRPMIIIIKNFSVMFSWFLVGVQYALMVGGVIPQRSRFTGLPNQENGFLEKCIEILPLQKTISLPFFQFISTMITGGNYEINKTNNK